MTENFPSELLYQEDSRPSPWGTTSERSKLAQWVHRRYQLL